MRHAKALVAALLAISSATATAATDAPDTPTDEQTTCAVAAAQDYEKASGAIGEHANADGSMSIEDTIARRRLSEDFCKRWAARPVKVDKTLDEVAAGDYDAVVLPGGQIIRTFCGWNPRRSSSFRTFSTLRRS